MSDFEPQFSQEDFIENTKLQPYYKTMKGSMLTLCAWCLGKDKDIIEKYTTHYNIPTSHGICDPCIENSLLKDHQES